ncbi:MAG: hypothetical protein ACI9DF_001821, partial [Verrucomicrobiales bacterium]
PATLEISQPPQLGASLQRDPTNLLVTITG